MSLQDHVRIARRFQRSVRIDTDLKDAAALEGFTCPPSSADVLLSMARHLEETGHGAFTWTGPYGSGKSSLVVALCAALSGRPKVREAAAAALGEEVVAALVSAMPHKSQGWHLVPVVGRRAPLAQCIGEALEEIGLAKKSKAWTDASVLLRLKSLATDEPKAHGGVLIIVDEMGKALEGAARDGHDIFLLQQIAELAARSDKRLVVVGILHQAFDEYAQKLTREVRDEWAKVQGRFVDLVVNASGDEQLELLARAIVVTTKSYPNRDAIETVAKMIGAGKATSLRHLSLSLSKCWPLHPVTAALLGPLSRRRFGQNQRSLFAFLNSAEPQGFHDFLRDAKAADLYTPDRLWDYLRINLEPSILASPDGHRWSIGVDALERCETGGASALEITLLKSIVLIDLFHGRSGLVATPELLASIVGGAAKQKDVDRALKGLSERSCIVFRRHVGSYALFAGSDFDIEDALAKAMPAPDAVNLGRLRDLAGLQPLLAKRHYHETGAIRWFNLDLVRLRDLSSALQETKSQNAAGRFLIAIPTHGETPNKARLACATVAEVAPANVVVGMSEHAWHVVQLAREFIALTTIHDERPELRGDAVARREVLARLNETQARLERELQRMTDATVWFRRDAEPQKLSAPELNALASTMSEELYPKSPRVLNELLNRDFPSSNAVKAQRELMKRMLDSAGKERLGLVGWPAEAGLMEALLVSTGLYRSAPRGDWQFVSPTAKNDPVGFAALWQEALRELKSRHKTSVSVADLYAIWRKPPFGLKEGLMPILALALYITHRERLAVYRQGVFQPDMTELDVDMITSDAAHIQFRWIELSDAAQRILSGVAELATRLDPCGRASSGKPLDIARSLVATFDLLPAWTKRTTTISPAAQTLAGMLRYATDPNRLLFEDVPSFSQKAGEKSSGGNDKTVALIKNAFQELQLAYPNMLQDLETTMFEELEVRDRKAHGIRERAANLQQATGDLRLKAFIQRLAIYKGSGADMEGIASLAIDKRPSDWVDADLTEARRRIGELAHDFKRHEEIARVTGRPDTRHRMAVIVPLDGAPRAMHTEFVVNAHDNVDVDLLIEKLDAALRRSTSIKKNIILAALAQISSRYMEPANAGKAQKRKVG
jgi:hypothetical protein